MSPTQKLSIEDSGSIYSLGLNQEQPDTLDSKRDDSSLGLNDPVAHFSSPSLSVPFSGGRMIRTLERQ